MEPQSLDLASSISPASGWRMPRSRIPVVGRTVLLFVVFVVYLGAVPFLITISPLLLYSVYLLIIGGAAAILFFQWPAVRDLRSVAPYFGWIIFYCCWGTMVAASDVPLGEAVKVVIKNFLFIGCVALVLHERRQLTALADWIQVAVLINVGISLWEFWHPEMVEMLATAFDPPSMAYNVSRPAGLWNNPDEAAYAYAIAFWVSFWARTPLAWAGRIGGIVATGLTVSRTGVYALLLCGLIYLGSRSWLSLLRAKSLALLFGGLALALCAGVLIADCAASSNSTLSEKSEFHRILDFSEHKERTAGGYSRTEIAMEAAHKALDGPWYGSGIFSFEICQEMPTVLTIGAHNIYITAWGETGILGAILYPFVLGIGLRRLRPGRHDRDERLIMIFMWISYLIFGLTWHNQFSSFSAMVYLGLLWQLPCLLDRRKGAPAFRGSFAAPVQSHR